MWKLIEISQQTNFIHCNFNASQEVTFILYDLKETWCQKLSFNEVKQNVKRLNKRFDYNEENIKETLLNGNLETATLEQQPHTSTTTQENCLIKLKYRVKNCPFNYEWSLRRQNLEEFQATFMQPLFTALLGCFQQVEILTDALRKKDAELIQYRKEGAILHRKTLATKPFNFNEFNNKYQASTDLAVNYTELAKYVIQTKSKMEESSNNQQINIKKSESELKTDERSSYNNNVHTKMSPKQRKRKAQEMKQQHLEKQLNVRKQQFEYENSQSQTSSSGLSQTNEETLEGKDIKKQSPRTPTKETDTDSDNNVTTPRRRITRCTPTKNIENLKNIDDKTDSENDDSNVRSLRTRNTVKSLNTKVAEKSPTKDNNKTKDSSNNGVTSDKIAKSPNLSYNILTQSPDKSNNIYDFSTDSEYEQASKIRKKSLKNSQNLTEIRPTRSSSQITKSTIENEIVEPIKSLTADSPIDDKVKNLSHSFTSSTPNVTDDISSQLSAIKKELECLEALRLADLKQRMCSKA